MTLSRRRIVTGLGAMAAGALARPVTPEPSKPPEALTVPQGLTPEALARDERFWATVARQFQVSPDFVNLENGYYGIMPEPVRQAYHRNVDHLNERSSHLLRTTYKPRADEVRDRLAALLGVSGKEIALTRGGTEALQNLIAGYGRLRPGDAVMYADLDYHSGQYAMNWLPARRGVTVERIVIPEPATRQAVLDTYERALSRHPKVRLLLLSHMNNRTGLVTPVRQIVAMARAHGVDVIVDAAHSWGQLDFTLPDLDADFAVFSLHKWMGLPLGSGFLYIREQRLADIDLLYADETYPASDIRSRVHSGTMNVAPFLTADAALDFHETLGAKVKQARLRYLRDRWVRQAHALGVQILTPDEPGMYGGITAFRLPGRSSKADNLAIAEALMDRHRIFTVARSGMSGGDAVRVTPALFTSADEVDRLAAALRDLGAHATP
ncbi:aminotransferase class V-fold PLP-dependent enzyme [Nonomuraea glycinis]|uniref:Isopenicillin-N epimerase n=1 Tax=Nonomuraea glycinis TaxID=2047744 RepID=A0A918E865_9ACTN|nr:aminotransferase class V-fold PLP-dependent enzyme [Nonomuraea glycinis]MCA2181321.1 aminotransferase class V-fold PLP-dependent enzyme [Nonomuraea glycinis]GGP14241.1 isopenicillin-N epimerase [Nonomuraea glycinis]